MIDDDIKLSRLDRYLISNQLKILEALYPDEAEGYSVQREAIENGYELIYEWGLDHIYTGNDTMTKEESREVWDTLDMFDAINRSATEKHQDSHYLKFQGYDGNNESKFMAFASYTVERLDRFKYVELPRQGYFNSHAPVRAVYQRMLKKWKQIPRDRSFELTEEEVSGILAAAKYPQS